MTHIKTSTGFEADINEKQLKSMLFIDTFAQMQGGHPEKLFDVLALLLGEQGKFALYQHCMDDDGIVTPEAVKTELVDLLTALKKDKATKNS